MRCLECYIDVHSFVRYLEYFLFQNDVSLSSSYGRFVKKKKKMIETQQCILILQQYTRQYFRLHDSYTKLVFIRHFVRYLHYVKILNDAKHGFLIRNKKQNKKKKKKKKYKII